MNNIMYTVFRCKKCEHNLYVGETEYFCETLERIINTPCPICGEMGDNWILSCRKEDF